MTDIFDGVPPIGIAIDEAIRNGTARAINTGPYKAEILTDEELQAHGLDARTLDAIIRPLGRSLAMRESGTLLESDSEPPLPPSVE